MPNTLMTEINEDSRIILTLPQVLKRYPFSRSKVYRLMWSGQLTGHKIGGDGVMWYFYDEDLRNLLRPIDIRRAS